MAVDVPYDTPSLRSAAGAVRSAAVIPATPDAPAPDAWPSPAKGWYAVFALSLVLMLSQLDRGVITLLVQPIKRDLHLSDTQVGELMGFAFISIYIFLSMPLARLSDRKTRRTMIAIGIGFWSLCTAACGLSQGFWSMFVARMGLGAGEAVNGPATYSILADYFPPERLTRAISVLSLGFLAGTGGSLLLGSLVISLLPSVPDFQLPWIGTVHNWQLVFMVVGLPGLLVAVMMMTVTEPPRRGRLKAAKAQLPFSETLRFLWRHVRIYGPLFGAVGIFTMGSAGAAAWGPTFYQRTYHWSAAQAGSMSGLISLCIGPIGLYLSTYLTETLQKRGFKDASLRVPIIGYLCGAPLLCAGPLMPSPYLALACSGLGTMIAMLGLPAMNALFQIVTPNQFRAQINSLNLLMGSAVGMGLGPIVIAVITDYALSSEDQIRYAMSISGLVVGPLAALTLSFAVRSFPRFKQDIAAMNAAE